jgi:hypothetical protein
VWKNAGIEPRTVAKFTLSNYSARFTYKLKIANLFLHLLTINANMKFSAKMSYTSELLGVLSSAILALLAS